MLLSLDIADESGDRTNGDMCHMTYLYDFITRLVYHLQLTWSVGFF